MRIVLDTDPQFPLDRGGQFGGHLLDENRRPVTLRQGTDNVLTVGIYRRGVWPTDLVWPELWLELKAMIGDDGQPPATAAALVTEGVEPTTVVTYANWIAGTAAHATFTVTSASLASLTAGTLWLAFSVADDVGTEAAPIAAGRVTLNPA